MSNTWGQLSYGQGNFGDQNNHSEIPTGVLATLSISPTTETTGEINTGWGRIGWNTEAWGISGTLLTEGLQASTSIGSVTAEGIINSGWGRKEGWNTRAYGNSDQGDTVTGQQLNTSFNGSSVIITGEINSGWGRLEWGENGWGVEGDVLASLPQLNSSVGTVDVNAEVQVGWGRLDGWGSRGWGNAAQIVVPTGQELNTSLGTIQVTNEINVGWGRVEWGNWAWGVAYSVIPEGQQLTSSLGEEAAGTNFTAEVLGQELNTSLGTFSLKIDANTIVFASEDQLDTSIESVTTTANGEIDLTGQVLTSSQGIVVGGLLTPVPVNGIQSDISLGTITLIQSTNEPAVGQELSLSLGQHSDIPGQAIGVSGFNLTTSVGELGPITGTANVLLTGIPLTSSAGRLNITTWQEIDPGVNNVWTTVDLAA